MNLRESARAKINLSLRVFGKRADGYHDIQTVMVKLKLADIVDLELSEGEGIRVEVPGFPDLENERNLAARAAAAYLREAGLTRKVHIRIEKEIPLAAGLGGGSSDAGAVLRVLQREFEALDRDRLHRLAASLGADVPFFLYPFTLALAEGIGELLTGWRKLPSRQVLLVNPNVPCPTPEAYQALGRSLTSAGGNGNSNPPPEPKNWSDLERLMDAGGGNDLQPVVERMHPEVAEVRSRLLEEGASFARMSGSGGTVFAFFDDLAKAELVRDGRLPRRWWACLTATA